MPLHDFVAYDIVHELSKYKLQVSLLLNFFVRLHLVIDVEVLEALQADTAFRAFAHFHDVLLDVLERVDFAYGIVSILFLLNHYSAWIMHTFKHDLAFTQHLDKRASLDRAIAHSAASNVLDNSLFDVDAENLQDISFTNDTN